MSAGIILKVDHIRTNHAMFALNWLVSEEKTFKFFSIGSYVKTMSSHGGHLEFPICKRFTSLVQDYTLIIPAKSQFNWLSGFKQEYFYHFDQPEHIMGPGSHVEFPISAKNKTLVYDHPMIISAKFGSNLFYDFRKKDENVKFP